MTTAATLRALAEQADESVDDHWAWYDVPLLEAIIDEDDGRLFTDADAAYIAALKPDTMNRLLNVVEAGKSAHDAWFGGLIDSDYDRMESIFDALRAALAALEADHAV